MILVLTSVHTEDSSIFQQMHWIPNLTTNDQQIHSGAPRGRRGTAAATQ